MSETGRGSASWSARATMADVADAASVSRTTVSFVLSGKENAGIPRETRERVLAAAAALGYRQNAAAASLASRRTRLLGVVTDVVTSPFAGDAVLGAQTEAWTRGYDLLVSNVEYAPTLKHSPFDVLLDRQVEALAVIMTTHRQLRLPEAALTIPTVVVNSVDAENRVPSIVPDELTAGRLATQHLLDAGHRRVALINLEPDRLAAVERRRGYEAALAGAGLLVDASLIHEGPADAHHGFAAAHALLQRPDRPTALFCATDRIAMGAYDAIKEAGLRIPEDMSVVGFDDQQILTEYLRPTLSTMRLPFREMAETAVDLLTRQIEGESPATEPVRVPCPLVQRASVAPPRDQAPQRDSRSHGGA